MKGLSTEIKVALNVIIEGLDYNFLEGSALVDIEPERMKSIAKSKLSSLSGAKKIINSWIESPNRPSDKIIKDYIEQIVKATDSSLKMLRKALSTKIDFDELEAHKHDAALSAKPIILESILDIDKEAKELRDKLENNDLSFSEREFSLGYPERFAKGEIIDRSKYYKKRIDEEGGIRIDPLSTKGQKIVIDDLPIVLPRQPAKKDILFHDLPKKEQYWRRPEIPNITLNNIHQYEDFIKEEFRRRMEGIWFYNNGKATYITGHHYFGLTYGKMLDSGGFMDYREAQRDLFYFMEACLVDNRCLGMLFGKSRRTGFTYCAICAKLNRATSTKNTKHGLMSKSGTDGQEAFAKESYMFLNLPFWFRPIVRGKLDSPKELYFGSPADNSKATKKTKKLNLSDYLNTSMDWRNTKNGSYDSIKLDTYIFDECLSPSETVLCGDLVFREVKDLKVGDMLMGIDGKPVRIGRIRKGQDDMYKVVQSRGRDYVVNSAHRLLFDQQYGEDRKKIREVIMTPPEYMKLSKTAKKLTRRKTLSALEFEDKALPVEPYMLGVWLGDGSSNAPVIAVNKNTDGELYDYVYNFASRGNFKVKEDNRQENCAKLYISDRGSGYKSRFIGALRELGVWGNKHIPRICYHSSLNQRLELLAGLIDTDGTKIHGSNVYRINMSRKNLVEDIYNIANLCGLDTSNVKEYEAQRRGKKLKGYSVAISDKKGIIPTKIKRKQVNKIVNEIGRMNVIKDIHYVGRGDYVGITLDTDEERLRTLVLKDYTLTKNCFKIESPNDVIVHLSMVAPTMMPAGRVVGKMLAGSTMGIHSKGGAQGVELIKGSKVSERDPATEKTPTGLYFHFLPAQNNMEEFTDRYGKCWTTKPEEDTYNVLGELITRGSVEYLLAIEEQKKRQSDKAYNEQIRTYPRTVEHMMRDESSECVFNMEKLYEQLEYNSTLTEENKYTTGNFEWKDGIIDSDVEFYPNPNGRFKVAWMPSAVDNTLHLKNRVKKVNNKYFPLNTNVARFGADPFSYKSTHGKGSKGGVHGKTVTLPDGGAPSNKFIVEYIARPSDETIFFEDVIKCIRFYGSPILIESNRKDLLRHMYNRGYRGFAMDRLDRPKAKLNADEKKYGGQMMSGQDIIDSHMGAIGTWVQNYVGVYNDEVKKLRGLGEIGDMPFDETLKDWLAFDPDNRTEYDATISSGLAIMACQEDKYRGNTTAKKKVDISKLLKKFDNKGNYSQRV